MTETNNSGSVFTQFAFSNSVKEVQDLLKSREAMQQIEEHGQSRAELDENLAQFIALRTSFYFGTASKTGEPYIQHRGGKAGFIEVIDNKTLRIPDYPGNRQYISFGNLAENPRAFIFMIDYEGKWRVKFWGNAEVENIEGPDRSLLFHVDAWDINCQKNLPDFYTEHTIRQVTAKYINRIQELEAEVQKLKATQKP